jgi:hypothetical protein
MGCYRPISRLCDNCHHLHLRTRENRRVVVVVGNQVATRKVFLWNQRHLVFGRARTEEDPELVLTLRFLPLKPESKHQENAERTKRIPRRSGYIYLEDQTIMVGNLHQSLELRVGGKRLAPGQKQRILDDRFRLDIIEGLGLSGTCLRTKEGGIGGLILRRVGNEADHEYWLVTSPIDLSIPLGLPGWYLVPDEGGFALAHDE